MAGTAGKRSLSPVGELDESGGHMKHRMCSDQGPCSDEGGWKFMRQESISDIVKQKVSDWKAFGIHNIFHALPILPKHLMYREFYKKLRSELVLAVKEPYEELVEDTKAVEFGSIALRTQNFISEFVNKHLRLDIPREYGKVKEKVRPFGNYPTLLFDAEKPGRGKCTANSEVPQMFKEEAKDFLDAIKAKLKVEGSSLENVKGADFTNHFPEVKLLLTVEDFMEEILQFLQHQQQIVEGTYETLFASFCAVAGLKLRPGSCIEPRRMRLMGVDVVGVPNMRAARGFFPQLSQVQTFDQLIRQTVAVVEVKSNEAGPLRAAQSSTMTTRNTPGTSRESDTAEEWITPVLGQLTGEMIAEVLCEETMVPGLIFGFVVQCTKVQVVIMKLPADCIKFITSEPHLPLKEYSGNHGEIFYSCPFDFLRHSERMWLWKLISLVAAATVVT